MAKIRDLYIPEVFNKYFIEENTRVNNLIKSGIVQPDAQLNVLAEKGGKSIALPFFNTLDGDDENLELDKALTPDTMKSAMDSCSLLMRGRAWKVSDLEKSLSGENVMDALVQQVGQYWAEREQDVLLATLEGVFKSESMKTNIYEAKTEGAKAKTGEIGVITGREFIKAKNLMGDNAKKLTAVIMHSDTFSELEAQNLIAYIPTSECVVEFPRYLNKQVIVDDTCPYDAETGVYTTYIFGAGAVARGEGKPETASEIGRNHLTGHDELVTRKHFILHPRGVKFKSDNVLGEAPSNADLKDGNNWERVYNPKNVRIVAFKHKI